MIELFILPLLIAEIDPADPYGKTHYPSGIKPRDKYAFYDHASCEYPSVSIYKHIKDIEGRELLPAIYSVKVYPEKNLMVFKQNGVIKGKLKLSGYKKHKKSIEVPSSTATVVQKQFLLIEYRYKDQEAYAFARIIFENE